MDKDKYCAIMINGKRDRLTLSFHSHFPTVQDYRVEIKNKDNIDFSVYSFTNIILKVTGKKLKPKHQEIPIPGRLHYTLDISSSVWTYFDIKIHKSKLKRVWYRMIFKKYNPVIYKFRIENKSLSVLDSRDGELQRTV